MEDYLFVERPQIPPAPRSESVADFANRVSMYALFLTACDIEFEKVIEAQWGI